MNNKSSFGFLAFIIIVAIIFVLIKFAWYILVGIAIVFVLLLILLINSSKKSKSSSTDLENQVREALSKIRQQKFKAENKINRLTEWTNDAISTTYGNLFGDKYFKTELIDKYDEIKNLYANEIPQAQVEKTDIIVNGYLNHIEAEKAKIETLDKLQKEHEDLKQKIKESKNIQKTGQKLDKHIDRLKETDKDLGAEETIIKSTYSLEDLKSEVELKQEYIKQLESLSLKYGDDISPMQIDEYRDQLNELKEKIKK
jgi:Ca2+/Na+ antiporter